MLTVGQENGCFLLCLLAIACQGASGLPLLLRRGSPLAQRLAAALMLAGALAGASAALWALLIPKPLDFPLVSGLPFGAGAIGIDPLSAAFLLPVSLVTGCAALYGVGYWPAARHPGSAGKLTCFLGILSAALTAVLLTRNTVLFLVVWEIMALAAWFALTTEDDKPEVRDAGLLYLVTAHLGALALFAMVSLLNRSTGSFLFPEVGTLSAQGGWPPGSS